MFIGTVLRSLEIEDLISRKSVSQPCYVARSFIGSSDAYSTSEDVRSPSFDSNEGDDQFYEAAESLADSVDLMRSGSGRIPSGDLSKAFRRSETSSFNLPSFTHISGLLPTDDPPASLEDVEHTDVLDSFVKAQIVICDPKSPRYDNIDKQV